jgi:G3E family GTPase
VTAAPLPVGVLVGFLGGGKTTLLKHLLAGQRERRIAVIVNDFAELNIAARLVRRADEHLVELTNGCICCTLRDDLRRELRDLAAMPDLDYVLIEATGLAEPLPIAQTFYMADLPGRLRLDAIITVVDGAAFWRDFARTDLIEDAEGALVDAPLAPLLVDQIEFSNAIVLNKADLAQPQELADLEGFVRRLNPEARLHRTSFGRLDPALLVDTGLYDYALGEAHEDWEAEWARDGSEPEEYGFGSFVYRQPAPLVQAPRHRGRAFGDTRVPIHAAGLRPHRNRTPGYFLSNS